MQVCDKPYGAGSSFNVDAAGLAVRDPIKQAGILDLLEKTLEVTRFPSKSLLRDLTNHWQGEQ